MPPEGVEDEEQSGPEDEAEHALGAAVIAGLPHGLRVHLALLSRTVTPGRAGAGRVGRGVEWRSGLPEVEVPALGTRGGKTVSSREIDVTCPCCSARLVVDVRTSQVLKTVRKEEQEGSPAAADRWSAAQDKIRERSQSGHDKLESALEYERKKKDRFDELFKQATDKHKKPEE